MEKGLNARHAWKYPYEKKNKLHVLLASFATCFEQFCFVFIREQYRNKCLQTQNLEKTNIIYSACFFSDFFIRYTFCNYLRPERGKQCISIFQNFVVLQKKYLKKYEKFSKNYVKNYRFNLQIPQCVCKNI